MTQVSPQLWFGKHKDKSLSDVPRDYLVWLERTFSTDERLNGRKKALLTDVREHLAGRAE